jgi:hypothetical protein
VIINPVRSNSPVSLILIPVLGLILWLPAFMHPGQTIAEPHMPLYDGLNEFFLGYPLAGAICGFLILLCEAFLFNFLLQQHQVIAKKNWLPALLTIVFGSCTPGLLWILPEQIAGLFLLSALYLLLGIYRQDKASGAIFNAGALLGIASLFYFPTIMFFLFCFITVIMLRPFVWREWVMLLIGFLLPFVYSGMWFFWHDDLEPSAKRYLIDPILDRSFFLKLDSSDYFLTAVTLLLVIVAAGRLLSSSLTSALKTKKGIGVMIWFMIFAALTLLPAPNFASGTFRFLVYPLAFLSSGYFLAARRMWIAETVFTLLLIGIAVSYWLKGGQL